jgi:uncharacterized membrane protein YbhN (UPF0104 family)
LTNQSVPAPAAASKRPGLWAALRALIAVLLIGFVISKTDLPGLFALRERLSAAWLAAALASYLALTVLKALQYYFLIGRRVPYPQVLNIVVIQNGISNFIAPGAGIASYLTLLRVEQGVKLSRAALAFLLTKVGDLISIWLFLLASSLFIWPQVAALHGLIAVLLTVIGGAILVFFAAVILRRKFMPPVRALADRIPRGSLGIVDQALDFLQSVAGQDQGFVMRMLGTGVLFSLIYMAVTMVWVYAGLRAFSFEAGALPVVFVNTLMQLISYLPIQIFGGLGVTETGLLYLYGNFGFPQTELAAVLIGARVLFYLTNLIVLLYLPLHAVLMNLKQQPVK